MRSRSDAGTCVPEGHQHHPGRRRDRHGARTANGVGGIELWRSDGSAAGTVLVKDINAGTGNSRPRDLTVVGDSVFFAATSFTGTEPWHTDGTTVGTFAVADLEVGPAGSDPTGFAAMGDRVLFAATTSASGTELYVSDGTVGNTGLVLDIEPGPASSDPKDIVATGTRYAWFSARTAAAGTELWTTDGTPSGTRMVGDLHAGLAGSVPADLVLSSGKLLFVAADIARGRELWILDPGASSQRVGTGCGAGAPALRATDAVLGAVMSVTGTRAPLGTTAVLVVSAPWRALPTTGGCFLHLFAPSFSLLSTAQVLSSSWTVPVPIPNVPALAGISVSLQAAVGPTATATGYDLSNAVFATLGI